MKELEHGSAQGAVQTAIGDIRGAEKARKTRDPARISSIQQGQKLESAISEENEKVDKTNKHMH